jgi:transposase-like protein
LGGVVRHWTRAHLNNRLEQDHQTIKGRYRSMRGFRLAPSDGRVSRAHDKLQTFM